MNLDLSGTSSQSVCRVEWQTNLLDGVWQTAARGGASIPGGDYETDWTDLSGPARNLNTVSQLFHRAVPVGP